MADNEQSGYKRNVEIITAGILTLCLAFLIRIDPHFRSSTMALNPQESIEAKRLAWSKILAAHPFLHNEPLGEHSGKGVPEYDIPDLLTELDYLKTMDPALGAVPYERLAIARKEERRLSRQRAPISGVQWQERGPDNVGGRTRGLMFDPNDTTHKKVWAGGIGGGLWYTDDITATSPEWHRVNDLWDNIAISTIAYNPANTQEFYVGTGEGWNNYDYQYGSGIWKSTDGGMTWAVLPATIPGAYNNTSTHFHFVQKIVVKNDGTVFAATRAYSVFKGGILRSIDGGDTWTQVLSVYTGSGTLRNRATDVEIAANGDAYASFGIFCDGKVFKSTNAENGDTWTDLSSNMNIGNAMRIELACAPSDSNIIYAVAQKASGLPPPANDIEWFKKSVDGGMNWTSLTIPKIVDDNTTDFTDGQAYYDLILAVHPTDPDIVLAGGIDLHRTTDGGMTWSGISHWYGGFGKPYVHADQHAIVFRPGSSDEVLFGHDGGITFSPDAGDANATPAFMDKNSSYNVTQFYSCATPNVTNSQYFLAGSQDNGTQRFRMPQTGSTDEATGGDGGYCHIDQNNPNIQLTSITFNRVFRSLDGGINFDLTAPVFNEDGLGLPINPSDYDSERKILYAARDVNKLRRATGIDSSITRTTFTLSLGDGIISALKVSPYNDVLIVGITNGRVYKLTNPSTSPAYARIDDTGSGDPITTVGFVSSIDIGANDNQILVTYSNYGVTSVWETTDGGTHWHNKEGDLPDMPVRWALYNPDNRDQVLLATELGVWSTDNFQPGTANAPGWGPTIDTLANTRCDMLKYRPMDKMVVVATHGRGLFTTDLFVTNSVADFIYDQNVSCTGALTVHFKDASLKPNESWEWDVDNDGTIDDTVQNPTHTYTSDGVYTVKLSINNGSASIIKEDVILVQGNALSEYTGCAFPLNNNLGNPDGIGIYHFALGSIDNYTSNNDGPYQDYSCAQGTVLKLNTTYTVTICTGPYHNESARVYIDYDNNGNFAPEETIAIFPQAKGVRTKSFTTPAEGVAMNTGLRLRVLSANDQPPPDNACDIGDSGQAEDYTVYFGCETLVTQVSGTGVGSLPGAVACASPGDTVRISATLAGKTIDVGPDSLLLDKDLVILANSANTSITGSGTRIFEVASSAHIELSNLTIIAGTSLVAAAIQNPGFLRLCDVIIQRNPEVTGATLIENSDSLRICGNCAIQQ